MAEKRASRGSEYRVVRGDARTFFGIGMLCQATFIVADSLTRKPDGAVGRKRENAGRAYTCAVVPADRNQNTRNYTCLPRFLVIPCLERNIPFAREVNFTLACGTPSGEKHWKKSAISGLRSTVS